MSREEILDLLREELSIDLTIDLPYYEESRLITVRLKLGDEVISSSQEYIPTDRRY